jgi:hypothetical protein
MVEPMSESLQRLVDGGQLLVGLGLLVMVVAMLLGARGPRGPSSGGLLFGGTLVTMGVVSLYAGRAAGGEANYQVGAVPLSVLVIVALLVMALLVVRVGFGADQARGPDRLAAPPLSAETYLLYAMVSLAYVVPVGVFAWRTWQGEPTHGPAPVDESMRLRAEVVRSLRSVPRPSEGSDLQVRLAEGVTAEEAVLKCRMRVMNAPFVEGLAVFTPMPEGACLLYLPGTERPFDLARPGDVLVCQAQGSETRCAGGWVQDHMGSITIVASKAGTVRVGGGSAQALPLEGVAVRPERHRVEVTLADGAKGEWTVAVGAAEDVRMELYQGRSRRAKPAPSVETRAEAAAAPE